MSHPDPDLEHETVTGRTTVELDDAKLRVLAHPLRMRLLAALRSEGPSTSSRLATRLGSNSGKTSYHLRQLADVGLVVEADELGDDRDRWWRAGHDSTRWDETTPEDPATRAAADWMMGFIARAHAAQTSGWIDARPDADADWQGAATLSDWGVRLRPDALRALIGEVTEVLERYIAEEAAEDDEEAERCTVILHAFPNPEPRL